MTPAPSTTFHGTVAGRNGQIGTLTVTVQSVVTTALVRPLAVSQATATVRPAGGNAVSLTGSFDDTSRTLSLSGGGYTFSGAIGSDGALAGSYTGPANMAGGFSGLNTTGGAVTAYCGAAEESEGNIAFAVQISSAGALSGMVFGEPACALTGRVTGASASITDCAGRMNTGTVQGGTISGRTPSGRNFSGSVSACQ